MVRCALRLMVRCALRLIADHHGGAVLGVSH